MGGPPSAGPTRKTAGHEPAINHSINSQCRLKAPGQLLHGGRCNDFRYLTFGKGSRGAYECRQSHVRILEDCLTNDVSSVLILEDDLHLCADSRQRCEQCFQNLPSGWDGVMLAGGHQVAPTAVTAGLLRCNGTRWTLAYAVPGRLIRDLYRTWCSATNHIDMFFHPNATTFLDFRTGPVANRAGRLSQRHRRAEFVLWPSPSLGGFSRIMIRPWRASRHSGGRRQYG